MTIMKFFLQIDIIIALIIIHPDFFFLYYSQMDDHLHLTNITCFLNL